MKQLAFDFVPAAPATLANFIPGRNAEVLQHLRSLASAHAGERFVYLWGPPGSGRTHLLRAATAALRASGARAAYAVDGDAVRALAPQTLDAAAVDDVEQLDEAAQHALFNLYNDLRENRGTLIAAGNAPPARLALRADVVTRLAWGLTYEVRALEDDEKAHALCEHAAARGFTLPPELAQYLLSHVQRDLGTLVALVESLDRYSLETKRPASVSLLRDFLARKR